MTTATATLPRDHDVLPKRASTARRTGRGGTCGGAGPRTDRGHGRAAPAVCRTNPGRRAATRCSLVRARRRGALALLAVVAVLGLVNGKAAVDADASVAGALDTDALDAGLSAAGTPVGMPVAVPPAGTPLDGTSGAGAGSGHAARPAYVVVADGDTLWDLVAPYAPAGVDPAVYVAEVAAAGGHDPRALVPGTVVRLP